MSDKFDLQQEIINNNKLIKSVDKQLKDLENFRSSINLEPGASLAVMNKTSESDPLLKEAHKKLHEMDCFPDMDIKEKPIRKKISRPSNRKLQI